MSSTFDVFLTVMFILIGISLFDKHFMNHNEVVLRIAVVSKYTSEINYHNQIVACDHIETAIREAKADFKRNGTIMLSSNKTLIYEPSSSYNLLFKYKQCHNKEMKE